MAAETAQGVRETITARVERRLMDVPPVATMTRRRRTARDKARAMPLGAAKRGGWERGIAGLDERNPWQGASEGRRGELQQAWHAGYMDGARGVGIGE